MSNNPRQLWDQCLYLLKENVSEEQYNALFRQMTFGSYQPATRTLLVHIPSMFVYEYLEEHYTGLLKSVLWRVFGEHTKLNYSVLADSTSGASTTLSPDPQAVIDGPQPRTRANQPPSIIDAVQPQLDSQLDPHLTFANYIEGDSNKLPRSVGLSIAEHPNGTQFNPMFIFGPSGCGKTHLVNAIGARTKEL